ncbi:hypothetical protein TWF788_001780 [Orbilia oligospora]|uniref:F-box domain-containing protein n=1 Tax=Orbilia oligospora TaxID=2813651 RepID=A0A7C8P0E1_ORBOL|nr:hypothetical protein TWF788_001780 [Orbilia oligospora]
MSALLSLPTELLHLICNEIAQPEVFAYAQCLGTPTQSLAALASTCRLLHQVATSILYRSVPACRKFTPLFRTLITREDLASHVREIFFEWECINKIELLHGQHQAVERLARKLSHDAGDNPRLPASEFEWLLKNPFQGTSPRNEYDDDCDDLTSNLFLVLTLLLLPKIEYVEYTVNGHHLPENLYPPKFFQSLMEINFKHWDTEGGMDIREIGFLLMAAPNVRILRGHMVSRNSGVPRHEGVRELYLEYSGIDYEGLMNLMDSFPILEVFTYSSGGSTATWGYEANPSEFSNALLQRKDTLRHVALDLSESYYLEDDVQDGDTLKGLKSMEVLETLKIDASSLYVDQRGESTTNGNPVIDLLPPSIKRFSLEGVQPHIYEDIRQLARAANKRFPNLKQVMISGEDADECHKLSEAFVKRSIT